MQWYLVGLLTTAIVMAAFIVGLCYGMLSVAKGLKKELLRTYKCPICKAKHGPEIKGIFKEKA